MDNLTTKITTLSSSSTDVMAAVATATIPEVERMTDENGMSLSRFSECYQIVHGYLAISVCAFGVVANLMNIIVLTRRPMVRLFVSYSHRLTAHPARLETNAID